MHSAAIAKVAWLAFQIVQACWWNLFLKVLTPDRPVCSPHLCKQELQLTWRPWFPLQRPGRVRSLRRPDSVWEAISRRGKVYVRQRSQRGKYRQTNVQELISAWIRWHKSAQNRKQETCYLLLYLQHLFLELHRAGRRVKKIWMSSNFGSSAPGNWPLYSSCCEWCQAAGCNVQFRHARGGARPWISWSPKHLKSSFCHIG